MPATAAAREVGIRHERNVAQAEHLPESFVVPKKECLVLLDRPAQRSSELIASKWGMLRPIKEIPGVQGAVAQELVHITMHWFVPEAVTMLIWAPGRLPYSAP